MEGKTCGTPELKQSEKDVQVRSDKKGVAAEIRDSLHKGGLIQ